MPTRKVSNRGGNIIGKFPSLKMQRMVAFESLIELDYLYLLDFERSITYFQEQPLSIPYKQQGRGYEYTPDFHVIENGEQRLVECKPHTRVDDPKNRRKFRAARAWCAQRGWSFRVVTDRDLRNGFRLENVKLLTQHARYAVAAETKARIFGLLMAAQEPITVANLLAAIDPDEPQAAIMPLLHMAFHHEIFIPLDDTPLSTRSPVSLPPVAPTSTLSDRIKGALLS